MSSLPPSLPIFFKFQFCPCPFPSPSSSSCSRVVVVCRGISNLRLGMSGLRLTMHDALDASDFDCTLARQAREGFCNQLQKFTNIEKETSICINRHVDLVKTALYIAAEDDSLVAESSVPLPVDDFIVRLDDLAMEYCPHYSPQYDSSPDKFLESIERFLYVHKGFKRSNANLLEPPELYLHSVLTHRSGSAAMLSLIYSEILKNLRLWGLLYFDAEIFFPRDDHTLPRGYHKQKSKESDHAHIMTSENLLFEILNNLKHAFWPFQHDRTKTLFLRAAHAANSGDRSDYLGEGGYHIPSAKAAQHGLDQGVSTSERSADMRRSLSACERLILLTNDANEYRDYSILLYHCGLYHESQRFLKRYLELKNSSTQETSSDSLSNLEEDAVDKLMTRLTLVLMEERWSMPSYARNFLSNNSDPC